MPARTKNALAKQMPLPQIRYSAESVVRVSQPFPDLLLRLRLLGMGHDLTVCFKHIRPERQIFLGWVFRSEISAPPVRESLQSGTLGRCQTADGIGHRCGLCFRIVDDQTVIEGILPVEAAGMCPGCHGSHDTLVQMRHPRDSGWVFVVPCHQGRCDFFCHLHIGPVVMAYTSSGAQTAWRSVASSVKQTSSLTPSPCGPFSSLPADHVVPAGRRSAASSPAPLPAPPDYISQIPDFIPLVLGKGDLHHADARPGIAGPAAHHCWSSVREVSAS